MSIIILIGISLIHYIISNSKKNIPTYKYHISKIGINIKENNWIQVSKTNLTTKYI